MSTRANIKFQDGEDFKKDDVDFRTNNPHLKAEKLLYDIMMDNAEKGHMAKIIEAFMKTPLVLVNSKKEKDNWISVNDRLPEAGEDVLCVQDPNKTATRKALFAKFNGKKFMPPTPTVFATYEVGQSVWSDIIYWMPLPLTPKELSKPELVKVHDHDGDWYEIPKKMTDAFLANVKVLSSIDRNKALNDAFKKQFANYRTINNG